MATAATLNPEPSGPAERQQQHLSPKSYVDATEENLDALKHNGNAPEVYAGQGEEEIQQSPRRNPQKKPSASRVNGFSKENHDSRVMVERYQDKDGEHLVSIKPGLDSKRGKPMAARRNSELVSGRKAGAHWEQSQYVTVAIPMSCSARLICCTASTLLHSQSLSSDAFKPSSSSPIPSA